MTKKREGRRLGKCECAGEVRGVEDFGRLFTWCEKCTPVVKISATAVLANDGGGS